MNILMDSGYRGGFLDNSPDPHTIHFPSMVGKKQSRHGIIPEQQRTVIWLKYHHGYTLREIAKLMDISLAWAQKIDPRAKKKLEELYREGGGTL